MADKSTIHQLENIQRWQYPLDGIRKLVLNAILCKPLHKWFCIAIIALLPTPLKSETNRGLKFCLIIIATRVAVIPL